VRSRSATVVAIWVLVSALSSCRSSAPSRFPDLWVVQGSWLNQIRGVEPSIARAMLAPPSVVLGAEPGRTRPITAFAWASYSQFVHALKGPAWTNSQGQSGGSNAAWFKPFTAVMYDPEGWSLTPAAERRDPIAYVRRFASMGHAHGWTVIVTPDPSLMSVPGAACGTRGSESVEDAFLRCDVPGLAARYADVVEVQAQRFESDPDAYGQLVSHAGVQARAANPQVKVIAALTTGTSLTASQMYGAWAAVRNVVDGYYLSVSGNNRVATAVAFLRMLPWPQNTPSSS
jgi:hypothetical protein